MRRVAIVLVAALACGCGGSLPGPKLGEHGGETAQVVPDMPPPGKVEIVPPKPPEMKHPVWIDGEWEWTGRRWSWKERGWTDAPEGMVFAPPLTRRLPDGRIIHLPGEWRKEEAAKP